MRYSKTWLFILLCILPLWICPTVSSSAELKQTVDFSLPGQYDDLSYVCVKFKGFPLRVLWKLSKMAPTIRQQLPEGLHVGREKRSGQGYLLFSYRKKPEGIQLSMRYQGPTVFRSSTSALNGSPSQLNQQLLLMEDSNTMVIETLKELFIRFCLAWEKDRIPADVEEIVSSGIRIATSYPERISLDSGDFDR